MGKTKFASDWIRTVDLWRWQQLLYQLSHKHCPVSFSFLTHFFLFLLTVLSLYLNLFEIQQSLFLFVHLCVIVSIFLNLSLTFVNFLVGLFTFSYQSLCLFPISLSPYFLSFYVCLSVLVARKTIYLISISTKRFLKQCIRNVKTLLQIFALISSLQLIFYLIISIRIAISLMLICHPKYSKFWPVWPFLQYLAIYSNEYSFNCKSRIVNLAYTK